MLANESDVGGRGSSSSNYDLPDEVLQILPSDPFEQLDVARKITSIALSTRVSALESESSTLRAKLAEKDSLIAELQSQVDSFDASLSDVSDKLAQAELDKVRPDPIPPQLGFFKLFVNSFFGFWVFVGEVGERERFAFEHGEEA